MNRRVCTLFAACLIAALAIAAILAGASRGQREPSYGGHPLSHWLVTYQTNWAIPGAMANEQAAEAIRLIGTNALPCLLEWIGYEEPAWRGNLYMRSLQLSRKYHQPWIVTIARPLMPCRPERPSIMALTGFEILGPDAAPAVPALTALALTNRATNTAARAVYCLGLIGESSVPALLTIESNPGCSHRLRMYAGTALTHAERQRAARRSVGKLATTSP